MDNGGPRSDGLIVWLKAVWRLYVGERVDRDPLGVPEIDRAIAIRLYPPGASGHRPDRP
jgi:hypothetical protein